MKIPVKKLKNGFEISVLGLGTWEIGGRYSADKTNDKHEIMAIQKAIELGINRIDTAELYANGHAEEIIGEAIKPYKRDRLFITSKVKPENLRYRQVLQSAQNSLRRLQTDYLDLYLIHFPNHKISLKETLQAMNDLVERGLVKNLGVSNFTKQSLQIAQNLSNYKIVLDQVHYNLIYRDPETTSLLKYCQENDIFLEAFRPIEKGLLAKKGKYQILDYMAKKYHKTQVQIALNWLVSQKNVVTVVKMTNKKHIKENLAAVDWLMAKTDIEYLRANFPQQPNQQYLLG